MLCVSGDPALFITGPVVRIDWCCFLEEAPFTCGEWQCGFNHLMQTLDK